PQTAEKTIECTVAPPVPPAGFIVMYDFDAATTGMQDGRDLTLTA
ncbi:hypothetical protein SAMN04489725_12925, partial [Alicyclobacillus hesperidum]